MVSSTTIYHSLSRNSPNPFFYRQAYAYWIMGCLSNDPMVLSMYAAFYKVFGAAGASIVFNLDAQKKPYLDMFASYWALTAGSMVILLPLVIMRVTNTTGTPDVQEVREAGREQISMSEMSDTKEPLPAV